MIGNDIIDLQLAAIESNWQRKGWLNKLFTRQEQDMVLQAAAPDVVVWLLWSMKESAYKIQNRRTGLDIFAPLKLRCTLLERSNGAAAGLVVDGIFRYQTQTVIETSYLHTIALAQNNCTPTNVYIREEGKAHQNLAEVYPTLLKDEYGKPCYCSSGGTVHAASKSHHGRFEALVF